MVKSFWQLSDLRCGEPKVFTKLVQMSDTCAERLLRETCKSVFQFLFLSTENPISSQWSTVICIQFCFWLSEGLNSGYLITESSNNVVTLLLAIARSKCLGLNFQVVRFFSCQTHLFPRCVSCYKYDFILLSVQS